MGAKVDMGKARGMTAAEAKKAGKVWLRTSFSGSKHTPLLGACAIETAGPVEPETGFLIYMLIMGHTLTSARKALVNAKAAAKAKGKPRGR